MTEPIKTTYDNIEITYSERDDNWQFELRGRCRTASTLAKAKEAIDAPPPKDKKPFARIKAYYRSYSGIEEIEITSLVEGGRYGGECWMSQNGNRRKVDQKSIFAFNEANAAIFAKYKELTAQAQKLTEQAKQELQRMIPVDFSDCE